MKFFICAFCSIFFFISSQQLLPILFSEDPFKISFHAIHGTLFLVIPGIILYVHLYASYSVKFNQYQFNKYNFAWYKQTYPNAINSHGNIHCYKCNHHKIKSQKLFNQTYQVRHYCPQCQSFLFYSPEKF